MRHRARPTPVAQIAADAQEQSCAEAPRPRKSQCRPKTRCAASAKKFPSQDILRSLGSEKMKRVRMRYKRSSRVGQTFLSPNFCLFLKKTDNMLRGVA